MVKKLILKYCIIQQHDLSAVTTDLSSHGIVVSGSGERAPQLGDLSSGFIDGDNISERKATETLRRHESCESLSDAVKLHITFISHNRSCNKITYWTYPACTFSLLKLSIILLPKS